MSKFTAQSPKPDNDPMEQLALLVVDDDQVQAETIKDIFQGAARQVHIAATGEKGVELSAQHRVDVILLDQRLPDGLGDEFCDRLLQHNPLAKIIVITGYPKFEYAVNALKAGAFDFLSKPISVEELRIAVDRAVRVAGLERIERVQQYQHEKDRVEAVLVGDGLGEVHRLIELAATTDAPVLISGMTGTGKSVAAKCIHYAAHSDASAFVPFNCAALPENLIEAELFGYEKGGFTGATSSREGLFGMAEGGTILLDEIGEMPLHLQSKLLSVLETRMVKRIGSSSFTPIRARIIAASNLELEKELGTGFRSDLYYRLNVIRIHIPPLRERTGDIPALCEYFLGKNQAEFRITTEEIELLQQYQWPGNVRELRNLIERAMLLQKGPELKPSLFLQEPAGQSATAAAAASPIAEEGPLMALDDMEHLLIERTLKAYRFHYKDAAQSLNISYSTLKRKMELYGIVPPQSP